jgi:hypothetical protein
MCAIEGVLIALHIVLTTMTAERINVHKGQFEETWRALFTEKSPKIKTIEESVTALRFI